MTAGKPAGGPTGIGSVTYEQLGTISEVSQSGTSITVKGSLKEVAAWPEVAESETNRTKWYLPLALTGKGFVGKTLPDSSTWEVKDVSTLGKGWVVPVTKGQKSFTFKLFASKGDADAKRGGTQYTVNLSGVTYGA